MTTHESLSETDEQYLREHVEDLTSAQRTAITRHLYRAHNLEAIRDEDKYSRVLAQHQLAALRGRFGLNRVDQTGTARETRSSRVNFWRRRRRVD